VDEGEKGGTATERIGKIWFKLCSVSVGPHRQAGSQKQLFVLPPCMLAKVAVVWWPVV
jgi:hypothetical protein